MNSTPKSKHVKSVSRAIGILDTLGERGSLSLSTVSKAINAPKTTAFDILNTLEATGMVLRDPERNLYELGLHNIELGYKTAKSFSLRNIIAPYLTQLNAELDETVHLTVPEGDQVLYIDCYESSKRLRTYSVIGIRGPLHCTSVGKALLAFLPEDRRNELVSSITLKFSRRTPTPSKRRG